MRQVEAPADPLELGRRLRGAPGLAVLIAGPADRTRVDQRLAAVTPTSFVLAYPDGASDALAPDPGDCCQGWAGRAAAPRWVGVVPYDAMRGLEGESLMFDGRAPNAHAKPSWLRYPAALRVDHTSGRVVLEADDDRSASRLLAALASGPPEPRPADFDAPEIAEPEGLHEARIRAALGYIEAGDIYLVNLARRYRFRVRGCPFEFFEHMASQARAPFGFFLDLGTEVVSGTSPELALGVVGTRLVTGPIKGTRPRGASAVEDAREVRALASDPKEHAELSMVLDLHRNDLGRVARPGSVRLVGEPWISSSPTVHSRLAAVTAELARGARADDAVRSMLPCGSVTGAPKRRAMQIIAELERDRRGLYTGAYGMIGRDGRVVLAVAIRTAVVDAAGSASYFAGGGIVWDSDPEREVRETEWKTAQLVRAGRAAVRAPIELPSGARNLAEGRSWR